MPQSVRLMHPRRASIESSVCILAECRMLNNRVYENVLVISSITFVCRCLLNVSASLYVLFVDNSIINIGKLNVCFS